MIKTINRKHAEKGSFDSVSGVLSRTGKPLNTAKTPFGNIKMSLYLCVENIISNVGAPS
jgi:hypothetical protein